MARIRIYADLFFTFARIALFVLGGGFAIVPIVEREFVRKRKRLSEDEFTDLLAVIQITPGIMAANSAVYVGNKLAGFWGGFWALLGAAIPSFAIICFIAAGFANLETENVRLQSAFNGVRAAVCGLAAGTAWRMRKKILVSPRAWILTAVAVGLLLLKVNPALVILGGAAIGIVSEYLVPRGKDAAKKSADQ